MTSSLADGHCNSDHMTAKSLSCNAWKSHFKSCLLLRTFKCLEKLKEISNNKKKPVMIIHQDSSAFSFSLSKQTIMDVVVSNVTLVDNGMGIMPLIYAPPSLSHAYANKTVEIQVRVCLTSLFSCFVVTSRCVSFHNFVLLLFPQNALIVSTSPNFRCSDTLSSSDFNIDISALHRAPRPPQGKAQTEQRHFTAEDVDIDLWNIDKVNTPGCKC